MKPTIGRIVHYHQVYAYGPDTPPEILAKPYKPLTRAALVTGLREVDGVTYPVLRVFGDYPGEDFTVDCSPGGYQREGVRQTDTDEMGCWSWPPRA